MPKKQAKKLRYEKDELLRWNLCQKIAKLLNKSKKETWELECVFDELEMEISSDKK